jgi:hypothetical protein
MEAGETIVLIFHLLALFTLDESSSSDNSVTLTGTTGMSFSTWAYAYFSSSSSFREDLNDFLKLCLPFLFEFLELDFFSYW